MSRWKLSRLLYGDEEHELDAGQEYTMGRGYNNRIVLESIVVSRAHCMINVKDEKVFITDLQSSNGVYVGKNKIVQNKPYPLEDSNVIGIGWTDGAPVSEIKDTEKFMFVLKNLSDNEDNMETELNALENKENKIKQESCKINSSSPILKTKPQLKRKLIKSEKEEMPELQKKTKFTVANDVINISDSDSETNTKCIIDNTIEPMQTIKEEPYIKTEKEYSECPFQVKQETIKEEPYIKTEKEYSECPFQVKQEYMGGYGDDVKVTIEIYSDSDNDCDDDQWKLRLSQSSPGKPSIKPSRNKKYTAVPEDSSYSQLDDFSDNEDDIIKFPQFDPVNVDLIDEKGAYQIHQHNIPITPETNEFAKNLDRNSLICDPVEEPQFSTASEKNISIIEKYNDHVDGVATDNIPIEAQTSSICSPKRPENEKGKKAQMIDLHVQLPVRKSSTYVPSTIKIKHKHSSKHQKNKNKSSFKKQISDSQKEERKKKLKEIATKEKEERQTALKSVGSSSKQDKISVNAKVTVTNRGAFLTDAAQEVNSNKKVSKNKDLVSTSPKDTLNLKHHLDETIQVPAENVTKKKVWKAKEIRKSSKQNMKNDTLKCNKERSKSVNTESDTRLPLNSLKPLSQSVDLFSGKQFAKVEPLQPKKPKKSVRFSDTPEVRYFAIEEGHRMQKTSLVKSTFLDRPKNPVYCPEKIALMKIMYWNPQWLDEQIIYHEPPPILGKTKNPMVMFEVFQNHAQYLQMVGDLLLMEIWECLTQAYKARGQTKSIGIQMRIESLPPHVNSSDLFDLSVNVSMRNYELKLVPRTGEVMIISFGPENARIRRFFYVHNVRSLPSPPQNVYSFFSISLQTYTKEAIPLRIGEVMDGYSLAFIKNELQLFDALHYLSGSPLSEAILRPEPRHFANSICTPDKIEPSLWTLNLNQSQQIAVHSTVSTALSGEPSIHMIQGPPGSGKSSVICTMVMEYFYDSQRKKQPNRGKVLICATSNTAVDELVIRLLKIRQGLPKDERFKMVRVGREESMHPLARDVSSQMLAQRDNAARINAAADQPAPAVAEELSRLQAKINMWQEQVREAKDPARVAYCESRIQEITRRIHMDRNDEADEFFFSGMKTVSGVSAGTAGSAGAVATLSGEQLIRMEGRIVDGADLVLTTLASASNWKIKTLKRRIALCIVDEAGQAIEPETLIPLTLDVTQLTLVGDPQQLPGFICSQRARQYGLDKSLFERLTSAAQTWSVSPVVLLDRQYRMQPAIADYPNRTFYGGRVHSRPAPRPPLPLPPYTILGVASGDKGQVGGANELESWAVARLALALGAAARALGLDVAVITPYNAHKELIKNHLKNLQDPSVAQVEVNTVDSFQGQERDIVIVSLARSQGVGFLTDAGRMNVMLTRARHALVVCLNVAAVFKHDQWRTLVEDAQKRKMFKELPRRMCQPASASSMTKENILRYVFGNCPSALE